MKVLFFSPYFYPYISGVTTYPKKILKYFGRRYDITVLTFKFNKNLKTIETIDNYKVIRMPFLFRIAKGFISPQSFIVFWNCVKKSDTLILNQPNFEGLAIAVFGKFLRKKIISIFHCRVTLKPNFFNNVVNYFLNFSMNLQLFLSDKIVAYTRDYVNSLPNFKTYRSKLLVTLPPMQTYAPEKKYSSNLSKMKKNQVWIGYAGRISEEKGLEYLVEAVEGKNAKLIFAGPYGGDVAGETHYYQKILRALKKNKVKYKFLGNLSGNKLAAFYKTIDLLVLPSINQTEAFGMVQAEAMMAGTPVIASNLPGVRVPINLTKMGLLVEPKNAKELAGAIKTVLKNRHKYTNGSLIKNAKTTFDIKKVFQFYDDLFHKKIS